jgi:hypothetical protein
MNMRSKSVIRFIVLVALILVTCVAAEDDNNGNEATQSSEDDHEAYSDASDADNQDEWYADDPYLPTDDEFVQQIQAEINAQQSQMIEELEHRRSQIRQILIYTAAGSIAMLGLVAAIFCTSLLLYDLGVVMLMKRYMREGVVVDGRIIVSDPDIDESTKHEVVTHLPANIHNSDSYSMMTDDESYQGGSKEAGVFSISGRSGIIDVEEGPSIDTKSKQPPQWTNPIGSEVSFGNGSNDQTLTVQSTLQHVSAKAFPPKKRRIRPQRYHVIVEYDDISYHDAISNVSSEIIRKRYFIMGDDVEVTNDGNNIVKLYVLKQLPKSGFPCGEVRRSLRWQKKLLLNLNVMIGLLFVVGGAIAVETLLSRLFLYLYIGLLLLQLPYVSCFLQSSFSKILTDTYLESGYKQSLKQKKVVDKRKLIVALKQGTSYE